MALVGGVVMLAGSVVGAVHSAGSVSGRSVYSQSGGQSVLQSGGQSVNHKHAGIQKETKRVFISMGHVVGEIYSKVGFGSHFSPFLATKQANSCISCCFLENKFC